MLVKTVRILDRAITIYSSSGRTLRIHKYSTGISGGLNMWRC